MNVLIAVGSLIGNFLLGMALIFLAGRLTIGRLFPLSRAALTYLGMMVVGAVAAIGAFLVAGQVRCSASTAMGIAAGAQFLAQAGVGLIVARKDPAKLRAAIVVALLLLNVPTFVVAREMGARIESRSQTVVCQFHLRQIGSGIHMYGADNEGKMPSDLGVLDPYIRDNAMFVCPSTKRAAGDMATVAAWSDYVYVGNRFQRMSDLRNGNVVAYCKPGSHPGGRVNVLFADGHVEWQERADFERSIALPGSK